MKTQYFVQKLSDGHASYWRKTGDKIEYRNTSSRTTWKISCYENVSELLSHSVQTRINEVTQEEFALLF